MATGKRYYWMKLKDTFMTSDTVDFLMGQPNGANYVVLYQMLCLKTINTGGKLSRQIGEILIPYDEQKIARDTKWFTVDTVRVALELYKALGLIYQDVDGNLVLVDHENLVGSETDYAERNRRLRAEHKEALPVHDVYSDEYSDVSQNVSIDIRDKDNRYKEIDTRDKEIKNTPPKSPSKGEGDESLEELFGYNEFLLEAVKDWLAYKKEKRQDYKGRGLQALLTQIKNRVAEYGENAVIDIIHESMAQNYQGILWDKLKQHGKSYGEKRTYTFADVYAEQEMANDKAGSFQDFNDYPN